MFIVVAPFAGQVDGVTTMAANPVAFRTCPPVLAVPEGQQKAVSTLNQIWNEFILLLPWLRNRNCGTGSRDQPLEVGEQRTPLWYPIAPLGSHDI